MTLLVRLKIAHHPSYKPHGNNFALLINCGRQRQIEELHATHCANKLRCVLHNTLLGIRDRYDQ